MAKKKRRPRKFIKGSIKRPGALRAKAKRAGGMTKEGKISKGWARSKQAQLRRKKKRTKADTRYLRQVNQFLGVLQRGHKKGKRK